MIATWLASAAGKIIVIGLAIIGLLCGPIAAYQYFQINGLTLPVFGHVVAGLRDAAKDLKTCQSNNKGLQNALDTQNEQIRALGQASADATSKANAALAKVQAQEPATQAAVAKIAAAKPGPDVCKSADQLILENVQ